MPINPFPEAQGLLSKAHKTGTHFSYGEKKHRELHSFEKITTGGLDNICIKLDLNETGVSSGHDLVN